MALSMRPFHANHAPYEDRHDDPLAKVLQPPPDESPADRARREQQQREATRISMEIDESIQEARKLYEKRKKAVKVLLLGTCAFHSCSWGSANPVPLGAIGQAESGKSTTLKSTYAIRLCGAVIPTVHFCRFPTGLYPNPLPQ